MVLAYDRAAERGETLQTLVLRKFWKPFASGYKTYVLFNPL